MEQRNYAKLTGKPKEGCQFCSMSFFDIRALTLHLEMNHSKGSTFSKVVTFTCSNKTCDRRFGTLKDLRSHQRECSLEKAQMFFGIRPSKIRKETKEKGFGK